jgi:hypothetical protein
LTDEQHEVRATDDGIVIGMSLAQVLLSGSALIHVGKVGPRTATAAARGVTTPPRD